MLKSKLYLLSLFLGILAVGCSALVDGRPDFTVDPSTVITVEVPEDGIQLQAGSDFSKVFPVKNGPADQVSLDRGPDWLSIRLIPISEEDLRGREVELFGTVPADATGAFDVIIKANAEDKHVGGSILTITVN